MNLEPEIEADGVTVGEWTSLTEVYEHALVVLAMQLDCWILENDGTFTLYAEPAHEDAIRREFALYAEEQAERRDRVEWPVFSAGFGVALLWVTTLVAMFARQMADPEFTDRFSNSNHALLERGEWWRPFTALFLHGDIGHLLSNVALGGMFCLLVAQSLGAWRGWFLVLAAGTAGNALTAWLRFPERHDSIGASTATFGALGILVGIGTLLAWKSRSYREFRPLLVPLVVGLIVLGWWGIGGERTDVLGHLAGWACGLVLGIAAAARGGRSRHSSREVGNRS